MTVDINKVKEFIRNNPNLSSNEQLTELGKINLGMRKTIFLKIRREVLKIKEPTKQKREQSIPIKYRKKAPTPKKPKFKPKAKVKIKPKKLVQIKLPIPKPKKKKKVIPFDKTKFGKIVRDLQKEHKISEKDAIIHARKILKVDKSDYDKINQKDVQILLTHTP